MVSQIDPSYKFEAFINCILDDEESRVVDVQRMMKDFAKHVETYNKDHIITELVYTIEQFMRYIVFNI